jgi:hypothetical protein
MGTPLYNTDIIPLTSRPTLTVMDDGDYFVILDTSTGKISKILKTNIVLPASKVSYDNATSGLTATQVQAALDELVVNLGSSDSAISALGGRLDILEADESTEGSVAYDIKQSSDALKGTGYTEGSLKTHEDRLDTLEADVATEGSVAKTVKDAVDPIIEDVSDHETRIDSVELAIVQQGQDLASVKQTLQQGNGATLDFSGIGTVALDARATGRANPTIEGLTATQLVTNGDFSQGTTGWEGVTSSLTESGKVLTVTGDGVDAQPKAVQLIGKLISGDKWFISVPRVRVTNSLCTRLTVRWYGSRTTGTVVTVNDIASPTENIWYDLSGISTVTNQYGSLRLQIEHFYYSASDATGKVMEIDGNYGVSAFNLTSIFGAGNEPDLETCQKLFSNYFDGTKSIPMPARVRSVGKNLWNPKLVTTVTDTGSGSVNIWNEGDTVRIRGTLGDTGRTFIIGNGYEGLTGVGASPSSLPYITGAGQFRYSEHNSRSLPTRIYYDGTFTTLSPSTTITVTKGIQGFGYYGDGFANIDWTFKIQLELGSTATPYEPYQDSTLYIADNEEVRSVQAVSDTISVVNGEHMLTKKISTPVSVASGVEVNVTNYPTAKTGGKFAVELTDSGTQIGVIGTDSTSGAGMLRFELAKPLTTPLTTSGILQAKQKGTVYYEPYYEGSHQTNASSQITLPYEGTIEAVYGYDENFDEYLLDSSEYSLTGTTLTIIGAVENEVFFVQMSRSEPLAPEMEVNVINNEQVIADTANGKFYKLVPTITNGSLVSQTPVEVV